MSCFIAVTNLIQVKISIGKLVLLLQVFLLCKPKKKYDALYSYLKSKIRIICIYLIIIDSQYIFIDKGSRNI